MEKSYGRQGFHSFRPYDFMARWEREEKEMIPPCGFKSWEQMIRFPIIV